MTNTQLLSRKISDSGLKMYYIANFIGVSRTTLRQKINNERYFNQFEIEKICTVLNITSPKEKDLIFFAKEVI